MNVFVIPEDFRNDQYILKPIIEAMFRSLGRKVKVRICTDPLIGGIANALDWNQIQQILDDRKGSFACFLLVVDRDGEAGRRSRLDQLEDSARRFLPHGVWFFGEAAWQEVEVWLLAGHDLPSDWSWKEVRSERDPKERFYRPFARESGMDDAPGEGRKPLAEMAARRYSRIRQLCKEDIAALEGRLRAAFTQNR